jgi:hypothetical protein
MNGAGGQNRCRRGAANQVLSTGLLTAFLLVVGGGCDNPASADAQPVTGQSDPPSAAPLPKRSNIAVPETYAQLDLFYDLQERVLELEIQIAEANQRYVNMDFGSFLDLDPWQLSVDQVYFLKHFCENGDFTLPKEAEILLLERQLTRLRNESVEDWGSGGRDTVLDRLDATIARFEQKIADLEKVAVLYRENAEATITYPTGITPETLESERQWVQRRQSEIAAQLDQLDERIFELRAALSEVR